MQNVWKIYLPGIKNVKKNSNETVNYNSFDIYIFKPINYANKPNPKSWGGNINSTLSSLKISDRTRPLIVLFFIVVYVWCTIKLFVLTTMQATTAHPSHINRNYVHNARPNPNLSYW